MIPKRFAAEVQSLQNTTHFGTWVHRKVLGEVLCSQKNMTPIGPQNILSLLGLEWEAVASHPPTPSHCTDDSCCSLCLAFPSTCSHKNVSKYFHVFSVLYVLYVFIFLLCPVVYFVLSTPLHFLATSSSEAFTLLRVELSFGAILCSAERHKGGEMEGEGFIGDRRYSACMCHCCEGLEWNTNVLSAQGAGRDCRAREEKGWFPLAFSCL